MFDVGFWEILLILVLALIVLGPERLPQAARTVGYWVGKARRYIEGVKTQVEKEFDGGELTRMLNNQEIQIKELQSKLNQSGDQVNQEYHNMFDDKDESDKDDSDTDKEPRYEILEDDEDESSTTDTTEKQPEDKPSGAEKTE